jgi:hypothetical protein
MGLFQKTETDVGVCASLKCPFCQRQSDFTLQKVGTAIAYGGVSLLEVDKVYRLYCPLCKYGEDIEASELPLARRAIALHLNWASRTITDEDYQKSIGGLDFQTLDKLKQASKVWCCSKCGEKVPLNFSECWKCKSSRPSADDPETVGPMGAPKLPYAITRPTHPWEH